MEAISRHLREDYFRFKKLIPEEHYFHKPYIDYDTVLKAHYLICDYFESNIGEKVVYGVKSFNLLGSALGRQIVSLNGTLKWNNLIEISATLFFGLIKNHAFHDGNKRTALLVLLYQLFENGRFITVRQKDLELLTIRIAENRLSLYPRYKKFARASDPEVNFISKYLRLNSRKIDKRYYPLTFWEFNTKLQNFNCKLDDPSGNFIYAYKGILKKNIFKRKTEIYYQKRIKIGFPGWKKQINPKAVKEVLKALDLTTKNGIDSKTFYDGSESMYYLIEQYEGPLRRLKDK